MSTSPEKIAVTPASYTTSGFRPLAVLGDGVRQFRAVRKQARAPDDVLDRILRDMKFFEESLRKNCGVALSNLKTLEIGHGQTQMLIAYIASKGNNASGVDLDVTPQGVLDVAGYFNVVKSNGFLRAAKSFVRELSGVNRAVRKAFCRRLKLKSWPKYRLYVGDATKLQFADGSMDLVYSTDVFEHLPNPEACLKEAVRVLRPGGSLWIRTLHFAHYNALHDLRPITGAPGAPEPWAHLFPDRLATVNAGAYINRWRIKQFESIAANICPGSRVELLGMTEPKLTASLAADLAALRDRPELADYLSDELLASHALITWTKPS